MIFFFFFNDTATTEIYALALHDALPISSDITNRADNVFKVERVPEDKVGEAGYSSLLTILKNREFGARARIGLEYNEPSKRLYQAGRSPAKQYSWEMMT